MRKEAVSLLEDKKQFDKWPSQNDIPIFVTS